jgi:hypothetical protein
VTFVPAGIKVRWLPDSVVLVKQLRWAKLVNRLTQPTTAELIMLKKIITWAIVIFIVFYLLTQPNGAAHVISNLLNLLKSAGNSLATFVNSL